jgi:hypothetical protein
MEQRDAFVLNRIEVFTATVGHDPVVVMTLFGHAVETDSEIATVVISLEKLSMLNEALNATRSLLLSQLTGEGTPN